MMWRWSPEVASIGMELIRDVPEHQELAQFRIDWLFMDKVPQTNGSYILGRARRVSGWQAFLAQGAVEAPEYFAPVPFGVVEIAEPTWHKLRDRQKRALVDHELCHFRVDLNDDTPSLKIRHHDFEEFTAVIRRHGLWSSASTDAAMALAEELATAVDEASSFLADVATPPKGVDGHTGEIADRGDEEGGE